MEIGRQRKTVSEVAVRHPMEGEVEDELHVDVTEYTDHEREREHTAQFGHHDWPPRRVADVKAESSGCRFMIDPRSYCAVVTQSSGHPRRPPTDRTDELLIDP
jgi:hypothetical protein